MECAILNHFTMHVVAKYLVLLNIVKNDKYFTQICYVWSGLRLFHVSIAALMHLKLMLRYTILIDFMNYLNWNHF